MSKFHRRYVRMHHSRLRQLLMWSSILELRVLISVCDCHFCLSHSHHQVSAWFDFYHQHYLRRCYPRRWPVGLPRSPFGFGIGYLLSTPFRFPSLAVHNGCLLSASHWTVLSVLSLALDILSLGSATLADPVGMTMLASASCQSCCSPFWYLFAVFPERIRGISVGVLQMGCWRRWSPTVFRSPILHLSLGGCLWGRLCIHQCWFFRWDSLA